MKTSFIFTSLLLWCFGVSSNVYAQQISIKDCPKVVQQFKKEMPHPIDAYTKRVDAKCLKGSTKASTIRIFDSSESRELSAAAFEKALKDPAQRKVVISNLCSSEGGFAHLLKMVDVSYMLSINKTELSEVFLSEDICQNLQESSKR